MILLPSPPVPPQPTLFFLSKKQKQKQTNKQTTKIKIQDKKTKKMPKQNDDDNNNNNSSLQKTMVFVLCWPTLAWNVVEIPSNTPLEKTDFPFGSRYQLQIAPWPFFICVWNLCTSYICRCSQRTKDSVRYSEIGVTGYYVPLCGCWNSSTRVLCKNSNC